MQEGQLREQEVLRLLRPSYEERGFSFFSYPPSELIPPFLGSYMPDAVALRGNERIAIEVKGRRSQATEHSVKRLSQMFADHPEWDFVVYYANDVLAKSDVASFLNATSIRRRLKEAWSLNRSGHQEAALLLAWSAFEAAARSLLQSLDPDGVRSLSSTGIIENLVSQGVIEPKPAERLRIIARNRNSVAHGETLERLDTTTVVRDLTVATHATLNSMHGGVM